MSLTSSSSNENLPTSVAWPTDEVPSRARFDGFGDFLAIHTRQMVDACQARRLPLLLVHAIERCVDHYWLTMPRLMRLRRVRSQRRKRTERRCAHVVVLQFLLAHVDLSTLQCVVGGREGLRPPSVEEIAKRTGLTLGRVEGVLADLTHVGYLRTKRRHIEVEQSDGSTIIVNQVAVRWLTPILFADLGLQTRLSVERQRATKRRREAQSRLKATTKAPTTKPGTTPTGPFFRLPRKAQFALASAETPHADAARQAAEVRLAGVAKLEHPDWDRERCYVEARRQLTAPRPH